MRLRGKNHVQSLDWACLNGTESEDTLVQELRMLRQMGHRGKCVGSVYATRLPYVSYGEGWP